MLKISLEIHDTNKDAQMRARAAVAMLHHIFGDAVLPYPPASVRVGEVEVKGPAEVVLRDFSAPSARGQSSPASDGYPTEEPDAATAFGGSYGNADKGGVGPDGMVTVGPERDKDGIPWDERIHASTKTTNKDGTWTRRRNTPDETFDAVMAELKAANTQRTLAAAQGMAPTPPTTPAPPAPAVAPAVPLPPVPASVTTTAPPAPSQTPAAAPVSPPAPASGGSTTFPLIMKKTTELQHAGKVTGEEIQNLLSSVGADRAANGMYSLVSLNKNPGLIPAFEALLDDHVAMQG